MNLRTPSHLTLRLLHKSQAAITRSSRRRFSGCVGASEVMNSLHVVSRVGSEEETEGEAWERRYMSCQASEAFASARSSLAAVNGIGGQDCALCTHSLCTPKRAEISDRPSTNDVLDMRRPTPPRLRLCTLSQWGWAATTDSLRHLCAAVIRPLQSTPCHQITVIGRLISPFGLGCGRNARGTTS
jgi:hypothetical protein